MGQDKDAFFDQHVSRFQLRPWTDDDAARLSWLRKRWRVHQGMTVVEPGCGAGRLTRELLAWVGPSGKVVCLDPSAEMAAAHTSHFLPLDVRCERARAEDIHLEPRSADRVICFCVFPHFEDRPEALRNLAGCLRPTGLLFISHLHSCDELNRLHEQAGVPVDHDRLPPQWVMRSLCERAGLVVEELVDEPGRYHVRARPRGI